MYVFKLKKSMIVGKKQADELAENEINFDKKTYDKVDVLNPESNREVWFWENGGPVKKKTNESIYRSPAEQARQGLQFFEQDLDMARSEVREIVRKYPLFFHYMATGQTEDAKQEARHIASNEGFGEQDRQKMIDLVDGRREVGDVNSDEGPGTPPVQ